MIEDEAKEPNEKKQSLVEDGFTTEASKAEKPEESLFDRTKRHFYGTLKYLSCFSRRGGRRQEASKMKEEDRILADSDCATAVSISTEVLENWHKLFDYYGDTNMIDCLPKEMLSHVTSFLPPKDFNSLVRTNKTTRSRLNNRDRQPLHIDMVLRYQYDDEKSLSVLDADISLKTAEKRRTCFSFTVKEPKLSTVPKDEQMGPMADWYYNNKSLGLSKDRYVISCDIKELLSTHLHFLVSNNVVIDHLNLEGAHDLEVIDLTIFLKENRMRVVELKLDMEVLGDHHMDLIHVCRPNSLFIKNSSVPSTFHDDRVVRQVSKLVILNGIIEMKEGDLAAYYSRATLVMWKIVGVTFNDMKLIIQQWTAQPRWLPTLITPRNQLNLYMATEDPASTCHELLAHLDSRLAEVMTYYEWTNTYRMNGFIIRRLADGCHLRLGREISGVWSDGVFLSEGGFTFMPY